MDGPFYLRDSTIIPRPSYPSLFPALLLSLCAPRGLREDLHYKYAPTGMHVRQYDVSLSLSLNIYVHFLSFSFAAYDSYLPPLVMIIMLI